MSKKLTMEFNGEDLLLWQGEAVIAKRGPGKTWISLEPGVAVYDSPDKEAIIIERKRVRVQ